MSQGANSCLSQVGLVHGILRLLVLIIELLPFVSFVCHLGFQPGCFELTFLRFFDHRFSVVAVCCRAPGCYIRGLYIGQASSSAFSRFTCVVVFIVKRERHPPPGSPSFTFTKYEHF